MPRFVFTLVYCVAFSILSWTTGSYWFSMLVIGIGFPHFILGIKYSKGGLSRVWSVSWQKLLLLFLVPISFYAATSWATLFVIFYFSLHHLLSETYSHKSLYHQNNSFFLPYSTLILSSYFIACRHNVGLSSTGFWVLSFLSILSILALALFIVRQKLPTQNIYSLIIHHPWLIASPLIICLSFYKPISWNFFVLMHVLYYAILPIFKKELFKENPALKRQFWRDAIIWNGAFLVATGALYYWSNLRNDYRLFQALILFFYFGTYWHITASFIISGANPSWIKRIFSAS